jgi:hypothetical protein
MKRYLRINAMVAGFDSPICKVAITLTNMDGEEVAEWVKNIGAIIDNLDPITDNIPEVWTHFLQLFEQRFINTQGANKARAILRNLKMKFPYVDQYISDFKRLASKANYALDARPTIKLFARGLAPAILHDVLSTPKPFMYEEYKDKAIEATEKEQTLNNYLQGAEPTSSVLMRNNHTMQPFQGNFIRNTAQPGPQYNSSNAPRSMNDMQVPMNLG